MKTQPLDAPRPPRRRGLHRDVVDLLGRRIVSGELPEGGALPTEDDAALQLDVSRNVVREAIRVLAAKGLVEARPRTGTRVQPRSRWDVLDHDVLDWIMAAGPSPSFARDLLEVRAIIETRAAAIAARRRSDADADRIDALLEEMAVSADDPDAYVAVDLRFHTAIMSATHNELLTRMSSTLAAALEAAQAVTTTVPDGPRLSIPAHAAVAAAIRASDSDAALRAMQELIQNTAHDLGTALGMAETNSP